MNEFTPAELRRAALSIACGRHPDMACDLHPEAFEGSRSFCQVRTTGGSLLITREEAEARARKLRRGEV